MPRSKTASLAKPGGVWARHVTLIRIHPWKASTPMAVNDEGSFTLVRPVHPWKALSPMSITDDGNVTLVSPVHCANANRPIEVTEEGIAMLVKLGRE